MISLLPITTDYCHYYHYYVLRSWIMVQYLWSNGEWFFLSCRHIGRGGARLRVWLLNCIRIYLPRIQGILNLVLLQDSRDKCFWAPCNFSFLQAQSASMSGSNLKLYYQSLRCSIHSLTVSMLRQSVLYYGGLDCRYAWGESWQPVGIPQRPIGQHPESELRLPPCR